MPELTIELKYLGLINPCIVSLIIIYFRYFIIHSSAEKHHAKWGCWWNRDIRNIIEEVRDWGHRCWDLPSWDLPMILYNFPVNSFPDPHPYDTGWASSGENEQMALRHHLHSYLSSHDCPTSVSGPTIVKPMCPLTFSRSLRTPL